MEEEIQHLSFLRLSQCGYELRKIKSEFNSASLIRYVHRDDYFMIGLIVQGEATCTVDFKDYKLETDSLIVVSPGQVHKFISESGVEAFILLVDPKSVNNRVRQIFDSVSLWSAPFFKAKGVYDLEVLFDLIMRQQNVAIGKNLIKTSIDIIAEKISHQLRDSQTISKRRRELMYKFRNILHASITEEHRPEYYAGKLNISTLHLNEIVHSLTGVNVSQYIANEIMLMAKRELYYTEESIGQIALRLGFDDSEYFTHLFTETVGLTPSEFRENLMHSN